MGCGASTESSMPIERNRQEGARPPSTTTISQETTAVVTSPTTNRRKSSRMRMRTGNKGAKKSMGRRRSSIARLLALDEDQREPGTVRILVIGPPGAGKTSLLRHARVWSNEAWSDSELRLYGVVIRANVMETVRAVCHQIKKNDLEEFIKKDGEQPRINKIGEDESCETRDRVSSQCSFEAYQKLCAVLLSDNNQDGYDFSEDNQDDDDDDDEIFKQEDPSKESKRDWIGNCPLLSHNTNRDAKLLLGHWETVREFWKSSTVRELWRKHRAGHNIIYGHRRFLEDLRRITAPTYKPTEKDIMWARLKPDDKQEDDDEVPMETFNVDGIDFELHDIGHQLTEQRRQWIESQEEQFDGAIFMASLADYNRWVPLKSTTDGGEPQERLNRMQLAIDQFAALCKDDVIENDKLILLLNKRDSFAERLLRHDIDDQRPFSDYGGLPKDCDQGSLYFIDKFRKVFPGKLDIHVTSTAEMGRSLSLKNFVLESLRNIIITDNLKHYGLLG